MPFTLAHPAAVLPLAGRQRVLPWAGLVFGAMAPDFEYFIHAQMQGIGAHSWPGLFLFCLPVGLIVTAIYRRYLHTLLVEAAPAWALPALEPLGAPWSSDGRFSLRALLALVVAVLVGAFTHLVWDGFTHTFGFGVRMFPELRQPLPWALPGRLGQWSTCRALQHLSTVVGLLVTAVWVWRAQRHRPRPPAPVGVGGLRLVLVGLTLAGALGMAAYRYRHGCECREVSLPDLVVASMTGGGLGLGLACALVRAHRGWRRRRRR